jgi:hypothetical protein
MEPKKRIRTVFPAAYGAPLRLFSKAGSKQGLVRAGNTDDNLRFRLTWVKAAALRRARAHQRGWMTLPRHRSTPSAEMNRTKKALSLVTTGGRFLLAQCWLQGRRSGPNLLPRLIQVKALSVQRHRLQDVPPEYASSGSCSLPVPGEGVFSWGYGNKIPLTVAS